MLRYLLEKEFKQILRNRFMSKLIVILPLMTIVLFPYVTNQEVVGVRLAVVDHDHSPASVRLVQKAASTGYFRLSAVASAYAEALHSVEKGESDLILEIPQGFECDLYREGEARLMISANSVDGMRGGLGAQYLAAVVADFNRQLREDVGEGMAGVSVAGGIPSFGMQVRYRFNPALDYKVFMVPGLIVILLTLLGCAFTALNTVGEKERGTIEQLNVSPVPRRLLILSKLMPNWIIGFIALAFGMAFGWAVHGVVPAGSLGAILLFTALYVLITSGIGMVISNYSHTMQQAMFVLFFFLIFMMLTSGLFTPVGSMPVWMQRVTALNPMQYFAEVMRCIYLKGSGLVEVLPQFFRLCAFAVVLNVWAVWSYKKSM